VFHLKVETFHVTVKNWGNKTVAIYIIFRQQGYTITQGQVAVTREVIALIDDFVERFSVS
jgi:hypothetical protein